MKLIPLSPNGRKHAGKYFAIVDDEDFNWLNKYKWHILINKNKRTFYATRNFYSNGKTTTVRMNREVLNVTDKSILVDHINHNGLDNRKCNLRIATYTQNASNSRSHKDGSSKYKGVYLLKQENKLNNGSISTYSRWQVRIFVKGKRIQVGTFKNEIEAALAYNNAAKKYHGEFANLNVIE